MNHGKQIIRYCDQGRSITFIQREHGVSHTTIRKHLASQKASGRSIPDLLALEDHELYKVRLPTGDQTRGKHREQQGKIY